MPVPQFSKLKPNPLRYRAAATDTRARIRPGPHPNCDPLSESGSFALVAKRIEVSWPREKKLAILRYWYDALVSDEKNPLRNKKRGYCSLQGMFRY